MSELIVNTIRTDQLEESVTINRTLSVSGSLQVNEKLTVNNIENVSGNDSPNSDIVTINRDTNTIESVSTYSLTPPGSIMPFAGVVDTVYEDAYRWLLCDGRFLTIPSESSDRYYKLYQAIGAQWGVNDTETEFRIPDFRGRFMRGTDNSKGNDPDAADRRKLDTDGGISDEIAGDVVGSYQTDAFQGHWHEFYSFSNSGEYVSGNNARTVYNAHGNNNPGRNDIIRDPISNESLSTIKTSLETRPQNAAVNYIIKY